MSANKGFTQQIQHKLDTHSFEKIHIDIFFFFISAHIFKYEENLFDHDTYSQSPRFASAYGIQSLPKLESFIKDTKEEKDLNVEAEFMDTRQHWPDGMNKLKKMLKNHFVLGPSDDWTWATYAEVFVYYSQVSIYRYRLLR